jgi:TonB family protein
MNKQRILSLVAAIAFSSLPLWAGGVKVVANPSVQADAVSVAELQSVFLEDRRSLKDGSHVEPVLAKSGAAHEAFLRQYVGRSDEALRTYYRTLVFTGAGAMPKFLDSDAEIINYVAKTKGAIGYVGIDFPSDGTKVLAVLQSGTNAERKLVTRVDPEYPDTLQRMQIGGTVRLMVRIAPKGNVDGVQLMGGNPILAESAIKAVKQWIYAPSPSRTISEVIIPFVPKP